MLQQLNTVLACLSQPAFVRDRETIRLSNEAAARLGLLVGSDNIPVELPPVDSAGSSCSCCVGGLTWQAQIRPVEDLQLVILEQVDEADAAVIVAAARALREPLQQISMTASQLWPYLEEQEDEKIQRGTGCSGRSGICPTCICQTRAGSCAESARSAVRFWRICPAGQNL